MKNIVMLFTILLFLGCSPEKQEDFNLNVGFELSIINETGEDLLDPNHPNAIKEENIKLFYVINDKVEEVYNPNLDNPRNFLIFKHENEYRIRIFQNYSETETKPITYVQWSDSDKDTIEASYDRYSNAIIQRKIWYNGTLMWPTSTNLDPFFTIVK